MTTNDDIFDPREGRLLYSVFRTASPNEYGAAATDPDERLPFMFRRVAYAERQKRALRSLLEPPAAPPSRRRDVHAYNQSTDGDAKRTLAAVEVTADGDAATAGDTTRNVEFTDTNPADGDAAPTTRDDGGRRGGRGRVRPKNRSKLCRLCCQLRSNVAELKDAYDGRCKGPGGTERRSFYTASEHRALGHDLCRLKTDVSRLIGRSVDADDGDPVEVEAAVVAYKHLESRYRCLRAVHKRAKERYVASGTAAKAAKGAKEAKAAKADGGGGGGGEARSWIKRYLCDPCYRLYRRFLSPPSARNETARGGVRAREQ